jgi:hypothetical protein
MKCSCVFWEFAKRKLATRKDMATQPATKSWMQRFDGEFRPPNSSTNLLWQFLMEPVIQQIFTMNTRSSKEYRYIFTTTWKQASTAHLSSRLTDNASGKLLIIYLIFSCCQLPFYEFTKHTTALHYRYNIQIYCTSVLFVNQHFPGLPASGTHCTCQTAIRSNRYVSSLFNVVCITIQDCHFK